jgi:hypothetical protein
VEFGVISSTKMFAIPAFLQELAATRPVATD